MLETLLNCDIADLVCTVEQEILKILQLVWKVGIRVVEKTEPYRARDCHLEEGFDTPILPIVDVDGPLVVGADVGVRWPLRIGLLRIAAAGVAVLVVVVLVVAVLVVAVLVRVVAVLVLVVVAAIVVLVGVVLVGVVLITRRARVFEISVVPVLAISEVFALVGLGALVVNKLPVKCRLERILTS